MDELFDKLKDGASKAKDNAEKIAKKVAQRTSNVINQTKLTFAVNEAQNKVKDAYSEIGKIMYKKHLDGLETDEIYSELLEKIDKLMDEISMLNDKIAELKNSLKCPECGAFNSVDSEYCSKCGAQLSSDDEAEEDVEIDIDEAYDAADDSIEYNIDEDVITIDPKKPE